MPSIRDLVAAIRQRDGVDAAIVLGRRALTDLPTAMIAAATLGLLLLAGRRVPEPLVIVAAGIAGVLLRG